MKKKVQNVAKRAGKDDSSKKPNRLFRLIPLKYQLWGIFLILAVLTGFSFFPEESVPTSLDKPHAFLLTCRNKVIQAVGLDISWYEDSYTIPNRGTDPVRVYFAPSPKICPALCAYIDSAVRTVDVCAFDLKLDAVAQSLIDARKRGITVRVVTDTDYFKNHVVSMLIRNGIPVASDQRSSLMHNKFIVVDSRYVWTGSYNLTYNCTWKNDNNAILIESPGIAAGYRAKFDEYWNGRFSMDARRTMVPNAAFIGTIPAEFAFSPSDRIKYRLLRELSMAQQTVDVMAFSFTGAELAAALRELVVRGVKVRCLFDVGQAQNKASRDQYLKRIGAEVHYSPNHSGKMHHKVIIIDNKTLITGSYNFSASAELRNDENILIVRSPAVAGLYTKEMNRCIRGTKGY